MRHLLALLALSGLLALGACSKADASESQPTKAAATADKADPFAAPSDVAKAPKNAKRTASGLAYRSLRAGKGTGHPFLTSKVTVHYTGWTTDGKMFDSSRKRGRPATFGLNRVIKGWTEGLQLMVKGETMRFWIPSELAYGDPPKRKGAPAGMLVFDVELISFQ